MFPSNGSATRRPLPSAGSLRVWFAGFSGTMRRSESRWSSRPASLWFAKRYHPVRLFSCLCSGPTPAWSQELCGLAAPRQKMSRWNVSGLPSSQATLMHLRPVLRPRSEPTCLAETACQLLPPRRQRRRLQRVVLSRLNRRALMLAVYASPGPSLARTQNSLPVVG
jgi:hypothetical protein